MNVFKFDLHRVLFVSYILSIFLFSSVAHAELNNSDKQPFKPVETILVWGDSLSAAYGISIQDGWVNLLQNKLGDDIKIINGSISGETTQGGLSRLPAALKTHQPDYIILELGANDGLRGISPQITKNNLKQMIQLAQSNNARVMLLGMKIPPNFGPAYSKKFEQQFSELAKEYDLPFIPFFLEKIIGNLEFFQSDELHPTAKAQPLILDVILPKLLPEVMPNPT